MAYCTWLTSSAKELGVLPKGYHFRLPTKKEWTTFATSGNKTRTYPWGDSWPPKAGNFANKEMFPDGWDLDKYQDKFPVTCPVTKSGKNDWGIYGVSGNVWEWNSDKNGPKFAVFGGSWNSRNPNLMKVKLGGKNYADPQQTYDNIGFRVLLAPKDK